MPFCGDKEPRKFIHYAAIDRCLLLFDEPLKKPRTDTSSNKHFGMIVVQYVTMFRKPIIWHALGTCRYSNRDKVTLLDMQHSTCENCPLMPRLDNVCDLCAYTPTIRSLLWLCTTMGER